MTSLRATALASSGPRSFSISARPRSTPAVMPADVPDRTVVDEDPILVHLDLWVVALQRARVHPVRRGATAVQKPRLGQHEGAGADRRDPPMAPGRVPQEGDHARRRRRDHGRAADHEGVERLVGEHLGLDHQARRRLDRSALLGQVAQVVGRRLGHGIGDLETRHDGQRHERIAGVDQKGDVAHGVRPDVLNIRFYGI